MATVNTRTVENRSMVKYSNYQRLQHTGQVRVAVAPQNTFSLADPAKGANAFDAWLRENTGGIVTLSRLRTFGDNIPVVTNILSAVDACLSIMDLVDHPKKRSDPFEWMDLGIDLIGVTPAGKLAKVGLRPALHAVRQGVKSLAKDELSDALYNAVLMAVPSNLRGAPEKYFESCLDDIKAVLKDAGNQAEKMLMGLAHSIENAALKGRVLDVADNKKAAAQAIAAIKNSKHWYDLSNVSNAFKFVSESAIGGAQMHVNNSAAAAASYILKKTGKLDDVIRIVKSLKSLAIRAKQMIGSLGNVEKTMTIAWFLFKLVKVLMKRKGNKKKSTVVPKNTTGTSKSQVKGQKTESSRKQAPARGNANCRNGASRGTGCNISFAMGNEQVTHTDFTIGGILSIEWDRTYSSDLSHYDYGTLGARWVNLYTTSLRVIDDQVLYCSDDGRTHCYPLKLIGQVHNNPIEQHTLLRLSDSLWTITHGKDRVDTFEIINQQHIFELTSITYKNNQTIGIRHDHIVKGRHVLSDVISKVNGAIDAHLQTQIDDSGRITAIFQVEKAQLTRHLASYQYSELGDLIFAQDENAHHWQYQYNHHLITRYTDRTGRGMNITYDGDAATSKAIREYADDGSFDTRLEWDPNIRLTIVTDALGQATWHYYDILGYTYRIIYPDDTEEWFYRDDAKNIIQHVHPNGGIEQFAYDESQNLILHTRPDGSAAHFEYNDDNLLTGIADGESNIWKRDYDQRGNLTEETDPLGHKTTYQYNKLNLPIIITDAKGGEKKLAYTDKGQLAAFTDCSGKTTTWSYDNRGRLVKQTNAAGETTAYTYSHEGRNAGQLESITLPDETVERFMHDAEGRLLTHTDPLDRQTNYRYSVAGLVAERIDAAGHELTYTYDKLGRLIRLDNENNRTYQFKYDPVGRLLEEVGFDGKATQYQYGQSSGVLERMIDGNTSTAFVFDPMGRLNGRTLSLIDPQQNKSVDQRTETFDYDGNGRLIMATNPNSKLQWFYDDAGNLEREHHEYRLNNYQHTAIWRHEYDPLGNRVKTIRPDGHTIELMTYGSGHVHGVLLDGRETLGFERDDLHREVLRSQANHLNQSQSYDPAGRLKEQLIAYDEALGKTSPFNQRQYQYDKSGQLTQISDGRRGGLSYRYDPIGRLLEASSSLGKELFAFDPAGNVQPVSPSTANEHPNQPARPSANEVPTSPRQKAASILDNLMREYVGTHYEYDERGNMTKRIHNGLTTLFKWDAANRMTESLSREVHTRYYYDALGRRLAKHSEPVVQTHGGEGSAYVNQAKFELKQQHDTGFTLYGWDGDTLAWESRFDQYREVDQQTGQLGELVDNSRTTHFIYEPNSFVPMMQAVSQRPIQLLPTPNYQAMINSPQGYDIERDPVWNDQAIQPAQAFDTLAFYQCDHLGTPQELTDMDGETAWSAEYKAWGEAKAAISKAAKRAGITNPIRFQGQYFDHETGLHYNRHRYYDPHSGRFVSRDPIRLLGGMNVHAYAPNPVGWIDPLGLEGDDTLKPGPYANGSIPARGPKRDFTRAERDAINKIGRETGCHTCGTKTPGTKSDDFILDHQTPNALNSEDKPQRLYPHCKKCSLRQAGQVTQAKRRAKLK